ncbi:MAG TPA: efflux transporter outer membrane subunit [Opitutales bacterium]|nr:efflux transporter outer membrane subunit [Opitutales bacterium]
MNYRIHSFVFTLLLAGCATAPDPADPPDISLPTAWTAASASQQPPQDWLRDLNAPELEKLIAEAMAHNADLERVTALLGQSIAEARISGADLMPAANFGLDGARQQISTFGPNSTGGVIFENYNLDLNLSWEIDLWGRLRNLSSAALARVEVSQAELYAARLSLAAQVAKAWFDLLEAKQQVAEAARTAETYEDNLNTLESRYKRGLAQGLDLRRIRTLAANAEADLTIRERALDGARRNLEVLLGRYPRAAIEARSELPELASKVPAGIPAELIRRRPDLVAAERRLAAADEELRARKKDLLPKISLTSSGGTSSQEFDKLLDSDFSVWSLAANLSQPIFQGGRILANIDRSASIREQAGAAYRDAALRAFLEVETTLEAETYLKTEYSHLKTAAEEANAAENQAWERYRKGTIDFLDVLDSQRTAATARARLIRVENLLLQNRIDLYLALGGAFTTES